MIIDAEGGTPDDSHEPVVLGTSSPDPVDVIHPNISYVFDQKNPSPIHTFSSSPNEKRKSPQDCESTLRVRNTMKKAMESVSRPDSDDDNVRRLSKILPGLLSRNESTVEAQAPSSRGNLKEKVALFERSQLHSRPSINLLKFRQTRKNGMKPKQVPRRDPPALPVQRLDSVPPGRLASFLAPRSQQRRKRQKATFLSIFLLKEWPIAVAIPSQKEVAEVTNLVWETGVQKVCHVDGGPTPSESQVKKGSLDSVKYVDIKRTTTTDPLILSSPSVVSCVQNHRNVPNATTAESPGISRTHAYAMGRMHIVGSSYRPILRDAGADHKEEGVIKREGAEPEKDTLSPVVMVRSGTAGDQADVAERMHGAAVQHTKVATHEDRGTIKEELGREEKGPHKITPSNVEAGRITAGKRMAVAEVTFEDQDQDGAEIDQMNLHEELARDEGRYNKLMKQEMEIRERKQKAEISEEILQTSEKDLCHHLEMVREMLRVVRQKKMSIERQEDSLRQKLVDARREHGLEETSDPKLATMREIQGVRVKVEAGPLSEELSQHYMLP